MQPHLCTNFAVEIA